MEKKKAIMKIESYSLKDGLLVLSVADYGIRSMIKGVSDLCDKKYGGYMQIEICPPYKKRTTDAGGQNRHIWGHIQQIANETGNDVDDIEDYIKQRALKRGYPYHINQLNGEMKPSSMKTINTVEAGYLIEELHQLAAELEINLYEGD